MKKRKKSHPKSSSKRLAKAKHDRSKDAKKSEHTAVKSKRLKAQPAPVDPSKKDPIWEPLRDAKGNPLYCSCGCGKVADGLAWDADRPQSLRCFTDDVIAAIDARQRREAEAAKDAEKLRETRIENLAEARETKALKRRCEKEVETES